MKENELGFNRLAVLGLGEIGSSIASAARMHGLAREVVAYDEDDATGELALRLGAIDHFEKEPARVVLGAQVVVFSVSLSRLFVLCRETGKHLRPDTLLVETSGATRRLRKQLTGAHQVFEKLVSSFPLVHFRNRGPVAADPASWDGSRIVIAGNGQQGGEHLPQAQKLFSDLGAEPIVVGADSFEKLVCWHSFLPRVVLEAFSGLLPEGERVEGMSVAGAMLELGSGQLPDDERDRQ
ncbi:MAG: prephenate dehydrogenase/arogenate dehydrogenase family protein, partial [Deltaproteobacteria bacterium]